MDDFSIIMLCLTWFGLGIGLGSLICVSRQLRNIERKR